jgi:integrase
MTRQRGSVGSVDRDGRRHWYWAIRLDVTGRDARQVKRHGYGTRREATAALDHVRALLDVAGDNDAVRRTIGDLIVARSRRGGDLPDLDDARRRFGSGLDVGASVPTLREWCATWLAANRRARPSTRDVYDRRLRHWWLPTLGDLPVDRVRTEHVVEVLDWLDRRDAIVRAAVEAGEPVPADPRDVRTWPRPTGPQTRRLALAVLSMVLTGAVRRHLIVVNPAHGIALPGAEGRVARVWSPDQVAAFLARAESVDDPLYVAWRLVVLRGLRRGEVTGLSWDHLDLDARTLRVELSLAGTSRTGGAIVGPPKTKRSRRTVSLTPGDVAALRAHRRRQAEARLLAGAAYVAGPDGGWVLARPDGSPTPPHEVNRRFRAAAEAAGVPPIRLHDGRHTAATLGFEGGVDVKTVSEQLGHSRTQITQDLYTHVRRARQDRAAEAVDDLVFGGSGTPAERTETDEAN